MDRRGVKNRSYPRRSTMQRAALSMARSSIRASNRRVSGPSQLAILRGARGPTETKSVDNLQSGGPNIQYFNTAANIFSPLGSNGTPTGGYPVEGAGFYNRIGRRIRMKSLQISGYILPSGTNAAAVTEQFARFLVIYDRQANGAFPAIADILQNYDEAGTTSATQPVFQHLNMNNRDRFQILRDRKLTLPALGINGATPAANTGLVTDPNRLGSQFFFREYIKLGGAEMHFKASTGTVADIATGSIFCVALSNADVNATPAWQISLAARLKFLD